MQILLLLITILFALATHSLEIDFSGELEVNISALVGADVLDEDLSLGSSLTIVAASRATVYFDLTINGNLTLGTAINEPALVIADNVTLTVTNLWLINGVIEFGEQASLIVTGDAYINVDSTLDGYFEVVGMLAVPTGVTVFVFESEFGSVVLWENARLDVGSDTGCWIDGHAHLEAGATLTGEGSYWIFEDVSGEGEIIISSTPSAVSLIWSDNIEANVTFAGASIVLLGAGNMTLRDNLYVADTATLFISYDSAVTVEGDASFGEDTFFGVTVSSEDEENILTVEGDVSLDGGIFIEIEFTIPEGVDIVLMYYGSNNGGTEFSSVLFSEDKKRSLSEESDYEVEYQEDKMVMRRKNTSESESEIEESTSGASESTMSENTDSTMSENTDSTMSENTDSTESDNSDSTTSDNTASFSIILSFASASLVVALL